MRLVFNFQITPRIFLKIFHFSSPTPDYTMNQSHNPLSILFSKKEKTNKQKTKQKKKKQKQKKQPKHDSVFDSPNFIRCWHGEHTRNQEICKQWVYFSREDPYQWVLYPPNKDAWVPCSFKVQVADPYILTKSQVQPLPAILACDISKWTDTLNKIFLKCTSYTLEQRRFRKEIKRGSYRNLQNSKWPKRYQERQAIQHQSSPW